MFLNQPSIWSTEFTVEYPTANDIIIFFFFFFLKISLSLLKSEAEEWQSDIFFVNRHGQVTLKRNLRKTMALIKLEDIVQHEDAMTKKFCEEKIWSRFLGGGDFWNCFLMKTNFMMKTVCDKTKTNQTVTKLNKPNCEITSKVTMWLWN